MAMDAVTKNATIGINQSNVLDAWVFEPDQPKAREFSSIVMPVVGEILKIEEFFNGLLKYA